MLKKIYRFLHPRFQTLFLEYKVSFQPRYGHGKPAHDLLYQIIAKNNDVYSNFLVKALNYRADIQAIKPNGKETDSAQPFWNNGFLPGLDMVMIYTMLAEFKPNRYIEVGSGNSTKVAAKAKREQKLATKIISIDPQPRAEIDKLADEVLRQPFENIDYQLLLDLKKGDILFIDNSHRVLPNSDAMVFFMEILPMLKSGVIVHIHDIYLPYDYPQFMCDRFYSEQYTFAAFIMSNPQRYKTLMPCYYVSEDKALSDAISPMWSHENLTSVEQHGCSYWLEIA